MGLVTEMTKVAKLSSRWMGAILLVAGADGCKALEQKPGVLDEAKPARLVVLPDGRKLNFRCMGSGSPTIVFESGWGATSTAWAKVQPALSTSYRTCSYDRAGYGFSDPGPDPRDGSAIAADLDAGLRAARLTGPFVLVGHSAGGLYIRLLAGADPAKSSAWCSSIHRSLSRTCAWPRVLSRARVQCTP